MLRSVTRLALYCAENAALISARYVYKDSSLFLTMAKLL